MRPSISTGMAATSTWMLCFSSTLQQLREKTVELEQSIHIEITATPVDMLSCTVFEMREQAYACSLRGNGNLRDVIFKS